MKETAIEKEIEGVNKNFSIKISVTFQTEEKIQTHKQTDRDRSRWSEGDGAKAKTKVNK